MDGTSLLQTINLPDSFGYLLLVFGLILTLAPWFHGHDFGIVKIPDFSAATRRTLKVGGPCALALSVAIHLPVFPKDEASPSNGTGPEPTNGNTKEHDQTEIQEPLTPPIRVLAEWQGSGCLYPADLISRNDQTGTLHFDFDKRAEDMPLDQVYTKIEPTISVGAQVFAKLPNREAWLPVTVRNLNTEEAQVTRDETASCAEEFGKITKWVPRSALISIRKWREGR